MRRLRDLENRVADAITTFAGSMSFVYIHTIWFSAWVIINLGLILWLIPWDPYPFGLLTLIVSLEAIFLSTFVLISQNRLAKMADDRSEKDYEVNRTAFEVMKVVRDHVEESRKLHQRTLRLLDKIEGQEVKELEILEEKDASRNLAGEIDKTLAS